MPGILQTPHTHHPHSSFQTHTHSAEWKIKYYPTITVASRSPLRHRAADVRDSTDPLCKRADTQTAREMCYTFIPPAPPQATTTAATTPAVFADKIPYQGQ